MPKEYEAIRDRLAKKVGLKAAKTEAAKIYNSRHPGNPVGRYSDSKKKRKAK